MRLRLVLPLVCAVAAVIASVVTVTALDAAKAKAQFQVTFGPGQAASGRNASFLLTLNNVGSATATLRQGDQVDLVYGTGDGSGDLVNDSEPVEWTYLAPLGTGLDVQELRDSSNALIGLQVFTASDVEIPVGEAVVLEVRGVAGAPGTAPVAVNARISRKTAKTPKRSAFSVMKTPVVAEAQFFGDGSEGAFTASDGAVLQTLAGYTDFLVPEGVTVTVPSGATIRCTGTFENRGTILVVPAATGGGVQFDAPGASFTIDNQFEPRVTPWNRGDALKAAGRPAVMDQQDVSGADGGRGLGDSVFSLPLSHYRSGGGGGSGALGAIGGDGGGLLRVLALGPIWNGGTIDASAPPLSGTPARDQTPGAGAGGGSGGVVILGSATSVDNKVSANANGAEKIGKIDVHGADGGTPDYFGGGGGGGGGGLVVFCAPSVRELEQVGAVGTVLLDGGLNASASVPGDFWPVQLGPPTIFAGGGGGGACVGDGGGGTGVLANGDIGPPPDPALPGRGQSVERRVDPRTIWN